MRGRFKATELLICRDSRINQTAIARDVFGRGVLVHQSHGWHEAIGYLIEFMMCGGSGFRETTKWLCSIDTTLILQRVDAGQHRYGIWTIYNADRSAFVSQLGFDEAAGVIAAIFASGQPLYGGFRTYEQQMQQFPWTRDAKIIGHLTDQRKKVTA